MTKNIKDACLISDAYRVAAVVKVACGERKRRVTPHGGGGKN